MERGHDVVLVGERSGDSRHRKEIDGIPVVWIPSMPADPSRFELLLYWGRLIRVLVGLRHRFDVLHLHAVSFVHSAAIPVARLLRKPVVVRSSLEGEVPNPSRSRSEWLHYRFLQLASGYVVISRKLEEEYLKGGISSEKVQRIPNGVDTGSYEPVNPSKQKRLRDEFGLPANGCILTYHGVFIERKSIHWALPHLEDFLNNSESVLLLIGAPGREESETQYYEKLQSFIESSPERDSIILTGFKDDVHRYLQASDMYLLPSTGEGLPNALLEAMATGLIPIVSRTSGSEEVIEHGHSGFLFEPRDEVSFTSAVEEAFDAEGSERGRGIARRAVDKVRHEYSIEAVAAQYSARYLSLIQSQKFSRVDNGALH